MFLLTASLTSDVLVRPVDATVTLAVQRRPAEIEWRIAGVIGSLDTTVNITASLQLFLSNFTEEAVLGLPLVRVALIPLLLLGRATVEMPCLWRVLLSTVDNVAICT